MFRFSLSGMTRTLLATLLWAILLLSQTTTSFAHAVVTANSLDHNPVRLQTATTVTLHFSSKLELSLSKVFLVRNNKVSEELTIKAGAKPGELVIDLPPLAAGEYALRYKVFAADGHLTEQTLPFRVSPQP